MQYSETELVRRYISGDFTDVQLNYLIIQNKLDKSRVQNLIEQAKKFEPFIVASKVIIGTMMFHFLMCFLYSKFAFFYISNIITKNTNVFDTIFTACIIICKNS